MPRAPAPKPVAKDGSSDLTKGKFTARTARGQADLMAAGALRAQCFGVAGGLDRDAIDDRAHHMLIEDRASGTLVCCFRLLPLVGSELDQSYAAQFYDLERLRHFNGLMCELGRFCVHPRWRDPDILRLAWAAMTQMVDTRDVQMLFGCSSFEGTDAGVYADAFGLLRMRHQAPDRWHIGVGAPQVHSYCKSVSAAPPDLKRANQQMPALLRTYLLMGGWVSDHAVVDAQMNTLHVFTGLEIGAIPQGRKRLLRALV